MCSTVRVVSLRNLGDTMEWYNIVCILPHVRESVTLSVYRKMRKAFLATVRRQSGQEPRYKRAIREPVDGTHAGHIHIGLVAETD